MATPGEMLDRKVRVGTVAEFDEARGLGALDSGITFHVIEIADGTRTIDVGQQVAWVPRLRFGTVEASNLVKLPA